MRPRPVPPPGTCPASTTTTPTSPTPNRSKSCNKVNKVNKVPPSVRSALRGVNTYSGGSSVGSSQASIKSRDWSCSTSGRSKSGRERGGSKSKDKLGGEDHGGCNCRGAVVEESLHCQPPPPVPAFLVPPQRQEVRRGEGKKGGKAVTSTAKCTGLKPATSKMDAGSEWGEDQEDGEGSPSGARCAPYPTSGTLRSSASTGEALLHEMQGSEARGAGMVRKLAWLQAGPDQKPRAGEMSGPRPAPGAVLEKSSDILEGERRRQEQGGRRAIEPRGGTAGRAIPAPGGVRRAPMAGASPRVAIGMRGVTQGERCAIVKPMGWAQNDARNGGALAEGARVRISEECVQRIRLDSGD
ncbi:unnamed protein product [Choristocarpus tenellus]